MKSLILQITTISSLLVLMLSSITGCGGDSPLIKMLKMLPTDIEYVQFADVRLIIEDHDLAEVYDDWVYYSAIEEIEEVLGIRDREVDYYLEGDCPEGEFAILMGDFDIKDIRGELEDHGLSEESYKDMEIWIDDDYGYSEAVLLSEDYIIVGREQEVVEGCIRVIVGSTNSFYEQTGVKTVTDTLKDGFLAYFATSDWYYDTYDNLLVNGESLKKKDRDTLKIRHAYIFEDSRDAGDVLEEIEDDFEGTDEYYSVRVEQSRDMVIANFEMDIEDF
ncbi:hypothetical protein ACFLX5_06525 [Chloroflexota bacterium]